EIIAESIENNDHRGFFAYVYRRTTAQIKQAILDGRFEDNPRMEKMDVRFANKYIEAYWNYNDDRPITQSWLVSFEARKERLTIMQHILMGMNSHINVDLGIAASETAPGNLIQELKNDFMTINDILASLTDEMEQRVDRVSRWMFLLNWIGGKTEESIINFSIKKARNEAWEFACKLAPMDEKSKKNKIDTVDSMIALLSGIIRRPPGILLRLVIQFISRFEEKNVKKIIEGLEKKI
ncbi:MAG: DUF5995 family protein, partial [Bacteroidota bacterium]